MDIKKISAGLLKKDRLVILLLSGVLLAVIAIPVSPKKEAGDAQTESDTEPGVTSDSSGVETVDGSYARYIESHLEEVLSQVEGVGKVKVMVTLKVSAEKVTEKDLEDTKETVTEEDSQGGRRTTQSSSQSETSIYRNGGSESGSGEPYVIKELSPVVEGVVVIASGGDNAVTIRNITEAVQALFDIDTHKIKIMKLNQN